MVYKKKASLVLLLLTISFFAYTFFFVSDLFYYLATLFSLAYFINLLTALLCFAISISFLLIYINYKKHNLNPQKDGKKLGILGFVFFPILLTWGFSSSLAFPMSLFEWPYFGCLISSIIILILLIVFIAITNKDYLNGYKGLLIYHNYFRAIIFILVQHFIYYLVSIGKGVALFLLAEATEQGSPSSGQYASILLGLILGSIIFSALIFLVVFYFSFAIFVSAKENYPLSLKQGLPTTKRMLKKYEVGFWFGVVINFILATTAAVSAIRINEAYIGLAILYGLVTIIKIPSCLWRWHIEKKYYKNDYLIFRKKHLISIYMGMVLLVLGVLALIFGTGSSTKFESSYGSSIIYFVYAPFAFIKLVIGLTKLIRATNKGDPFLSARSFVDILMSLFIFGNTAYMISGLLSNTNGGDTWYVVATSLGYILNVYVLLISVFTIIIGILGATGKLKKQYDYFEEEIIKVNRGHLEKIVNKK